jgi:CheY-like chemotaxis protein
MSSQEEHLVLLADIDRVYSSALSSQLSDIGFKTAIANDGFQLVEMFEHLNPSIIVADLKTPSLDIINLIDITKSRSASIPFIITTAHEDIDLAIQAIHKGAFDYIVKPYQPEILCQKINQAIQATRLARENIVLNELVSLYDITSKLTSTHDLDELLDITFQYCLQISRADDGMLQLVDKDNGELVIVRHKGNFTENQRSQLTNPAEWMISKWVYLHGKSLLIANGKTIPSTNLNLTNLTSCSGISVPLKISDEIIGIVSLGRSDEQDPFTIIDLNVIDVLASQAGIAINNANLYSSINQKLDELMLISNYSEQLMGIVDKYDVINCLFETVIKHFPIDVIGFLIVQRRNHEFLYCREG